MSTFLSTRKSSLLMRLRINRTLGLLPSILQKFLLWCRAKIQLLWWFFKPLQVMAVWCLLISSKQALKSIQWSSWKFWKMFWRCGYLGTTAPSKWCSFKILRPHMEHRRFRTSWRRIFLWWSRRIVGPAAPQIWIFVSIGCLASLRESLT